MGTLIFSVTNKNITMNKEKGFTWKLGMFVIIGLLLFVSTIYYVGKQNNLFGDTFHLKTTFKNVSGLKEGNNVRFSGINIGTVNEIVILTDTSVLVDLILEKKVMKFIKTDAVAAIGSVQYFRIELVGLTDLFKVSQLQYHRNVSGIDK